MSPSAVRHSRPEYHLSVAGQIRALRLSRGWTQRELGERMGVAQAEVSRLENPACDTYTVGTLQRLAAALGVALEVRFQALR